jgi:hypothetical protein
MTETNCSTDFVQRRILILAGVILLSAPGVRAAPASQTLIFEEDRNPGGVRNTFSTRSADSTIVIAPTAVGFRTDRGSSRMVFEHANPLAQARGLGVQAGQFSYLRGKDAARWVTNVFRYSRLQIPELYPGIDVLYYGSDRQLEYDFLVGPGSDPAQIKLHFENAGRPQVLTNGDLVLGPDGSLRMLKPTIYQETTGGKRKVIEGGYVLHAHNRVGFRIGAYDHSRTLIIDPILSYSTYLGGTSDETAYGVATDSSGNTYVVGSSSSSNFPATSGAYKNVSQGGTSDVVVTKYSPAGTVIYSTYIGGSGADIGYGIAVDSAGNAYITGSTSSPDFPVTAGAYSSTYRGGSSNAFIAKLNAAGNTLLYSTYLGGSGEDVAYSLALNASNEATIAGSTSSTDFPATSGAFRTTNGGGITEGFVARLNAAGTALLYATYLGGSGEDVAYGVALDTPGNAYVTGYTRSTNFPVSAGAAQSTIAGGYDTFVTALNPGGTALVYSTYLGGSREDYGLGIAVDANSNAYITGYTASPDFPHTTGVVQATHRGGYDATVTKLTASGALAYSTFLGGSADDYGLAIAMDSGGNAYITGDSSSTDFPIAGPVQGPPGGVFNAFVTQVNASGTAVNYSTYLGGGGFETGYGIAVDASGAAYVVGNTVSSDFPVTASAAQPSLGGGSDAFFARIIVGAPQTITFATLSGVAIGVPPFLLSATASSGLAVSFSSGTTAVCSVAGMTVTVFAVGTCTMTASQPGNTTYEAASPAVRSFTVSPAAQTITFGVLSSVAFGAAPFTISATASSGLAVTFTSNTLPVCLVSGSTVTIVSVGTCSITASQAGNASFGVATPVTQTFAVGLGAQTITFAQPADIALTAGPVTLAATATSNLTVSYTGNTAAVCIVAGSSVTLVSPGTCSITANQSGNGTFAAATAVTKAFSVLKGAQTISLTQPADTALNAGPVSLTATATSGLAVSFASNTAAVCTASGSSVTLASVGLCSITAMQPGDINYNAATAVTKTFNVTANSNVITFPQPANTALTAGPVALTATATSNLAVSYTSNTTAVCTVSGFSVTLVSAGTCSITANQAGNGTFASATPVTKTFSVLKGAQTISFIQPADTVLSAGPVTLTATATSGLAVSFGSNTGAVCTASGSSVTLVAVGTCSITANQAGNGTFLAATAVTRTFAVSQPVQNPTVTLAVGDGNGFAGDTVEIPIQLTSVGTPALSTFQFDLNFDPQKMTFKSARTGAQLTAASKSISTSAQPNGEIRLLAVGFNQNVISNGVVAYATFTLGSSFTASAVTPKACTSADAQGSIIATACTVGTIRPPSCDINADGFTNVADVQLIINEALGVSPATHDLNHDGAVNVADVQKVINAALGLGCSVP